MPCLSSQGALTYVLEHLVLWRLTITATENMKRSKGTIVSQGSSGTGAAGVAVGVAEGVAVGVGAGVVWAAVAFTEK